MLGDQIDFFVRELNNGQPLAIFLIKEIFRNHKDNLTGKAQAVVKYIVRAEESLPITSVAKYHFLNALKTFTKCKDKIVKKSQSEILMQMSGSEDAMICSYFNTRDGIARVRNLAERAEKTRHDSGGGMAEVDVPVEVANLIAFIELVNMC